MTLKNNLARVVRWRSAKATQTLYKALGHLTHTGFIIPKIYRL